MIELHYQKLLWSSMTIIDAFLVMMAQSLEETQIRNQIAYSTVDIVGSQSQALQKLYFRF